MIAKAGETRGSRTPLLRHTYMTIICLLFVALSQVQKRPELENIVTCTSLLFRMSVDSSKSDSDSDWSGRWNHVRKLLERSGPFAHPDFEPSSEVSN